MTSVTELGSLNFKLIESDTIKLVTVKFDRKNDSLMDSLNLNAKTINIIHLNESFKISSNIPLANIEDSLITIRDIDSFAIPFSTKINSELNEIDISFDVVPSDNYNIFMRIIFLPPFFITHCYTVVMLFMYFTTNYNIIPIHCIQDLSFFSFLFSVCRSF